ncbi:uncharacterized protein L3040_008995 [Drepanopeziza brunnea f. sp. 'multigermtubi']|uniref:uncharacterized protein n=1 Tax=Drepanopeziza brunnea f. sp. 'multigermtubi' TaxID=698441 RepID=UPI0023A04C03|nr:hypothetical protein L3040_008995 [Drepanopeziza brunnea f. sp. 'multigermtubi']
MWRGVAISIKGFSKVENCLTNPGQGEKLGGTPRNILPTLLQNKSLNFLLLPALTSSSSSNSSLEYHKATLCFPPSPAQLSWWLFQIPPPCPFCLVPRKLSWRPSPDTQQFVEGHHFNSSDYPLLPSNSFHAHDTT